jgi:kynurenine formamidase
MARLSRRGFFRGAGAAAVAAVATQALPSVAAAQTMTFSKVVDLTHTLTPDFPTFFGEPQLEIEQVFNFAEHKFNVNRWHIVEHTGTHMDAPLHVSADGPSVDELDPARLVAPLAVIDVKAKAAESADYQVTADDIRAWEQANGQLPANCCVAMNSGWAEHLRTDKFRNADAAGVMHFPGFHPDAARFMMEERQVAGIAVDTLSLDFGPSKDFATHFLWLPSGRWGLEAVANLDQAPASGAMLVVGGPKVAGASGGPSRVFAISA